MAHLEIQFEKRSPVIWKTKSSRAKLINSASNKLQVLFFGTGRPKTSSTSPRNGIVKQRTVDVAGNIEEKEK